MSLSSIPIKKMVRLLLAILGRFGLSPKKKPPNGTLVYGSDIEETRIPFLSQLKMGSELGSNSGLVLDLSVLGKLTKERKIQEAG